MGDGFKGFMYGFGITAGVIAGIYAGFKGIEMIGYYSAQKDTKKEADFNSRVSRAVEEELAKRALPTA